MSYDSADPGGAAEGVSGYGPDGRTAGDMAPTERTLQTDWGSVLKDTALGFLFSGGNPIAAGTAGVKSGISNTRQVDTPINLGGTFGEGAPGGFTGGSPGTTSGGGPMAGNNAADGAGSNPFDGGLSSMLGIAGGLTSVIGGLSGGGSSSGAKSSVTNAADPSAPYRAGWASQYNDAMKSGGTVDPTMMPGYSQWKSGVLDPAMQASERSAAKAGMLYSGNEKEALLKTGQQGYYGFMTDYMNRLAQGSGAANNPATAVGMGLQNKNQNQQGVMQGLGGIAQGIGGLGGFFGGSGSTGGGTSSADMASQYQYGGPSVGSYGVDPSGGWTDPGSSDSWAGDGSSNIFNWFTGPQ